MCVKATETGFYPMGRPLGPILYGSPLTFRAGIEWGLTSSGILIINRNFITLINFFLYILSRVYYLCSDDCFLIIVILIF